MQTELWLFYTAIVVLGLCVGSFLNVVVYRLPLIMERDWKTECHAFLELQGEPPVDAALNKLGLATPRSACTACGHTLSAWENIPLLSYLLLGGKCSSCKQRISLQYPLVELFTAVLSLIVAMHFGVTLAMLAALLFTWSLIALALIDYHKQLLPDSITYPLLWLGIALAFRGDFTTLESSVVGAMAGYLSLWLVYHLFRLVTGKEGMGHGDFKLLAALGAWCGWQLLPVIILLSSLVGSVAGILMLLTGLTRRAQPIPFGPYLAAAGWIALLWGPAINDAWLAVFR